MGWCKCLACLLPACAHSYTSGLLKGEHNHIHQKEPISVVPSSLGLPPSKVCSMSGQVSLVALWPAKPLYPAARGKHSLSPGCSVGGKGIVLLLRAAGAGFILLFRGV